QDQQNQRQRKQNHRKLCNPRSGVLNTRAGAHAGSVDSGAAPSSRRNVRPLRLACTRSVGGLSRQRGQEGIGKGVPEQCFQTFRCRRLVVIERFADGPEVTCQSAFPALRTPDAHTSPTRTALRSFRYGAISTETLSPRSHTASSSAFSNAVPARRAPARL